MTSLLSIYHVGQACLSAYSGLLSYTSIVKLQQYEEKSEKAAEYSNTAAHQLHKSRTTQASGALGTVCSLVSAITLVTSISSEQWQIPLAVGVVNAVGLTFAHSHVSNFWRAKAKVPFVRDFNDAITTSNQMRQALGALAWSWVGVCVVYIYRAVTL